MAPVDQRYEYGGVPPDTDKLILPSEPLLQETFEVIAVITGIYKQLPSSMVAFGSKLEALTSVQP